MLPRLAVAALGGAASFDVLAATKVLMVVSAWRSVATDTTSASAAFSRASACSFIDPAVTTPSASAFTAATALRTATGTAVEAPTRVAAACTRLDTTALLTVPPLLSAALPCSSTPAAAATSP